MDVSTNELLLALRAPNSTWLAALVCALDEALRDPDFGEPQRALVRALLDGGHVPTAVSRSAHARLEQFEQSLIDDMLADEVQPMAAMRPKLTLCGSAA